MYFFELKELITTYLRMTIPREKWDEIDDMFTEMYLINENGSELICLKPQLSGSGDGGQGISLMFYTLNGAYYDIGYWNDIKQKGESISNIKDMADI